MSKRIFLYFALLVAILGLAGCVSVPSQDKKPSGGNYGIYKSEDAGITWQHKVAVLNSLGQPLTISDVNVNKIIIDPANKDAIANKASYYLATNKGLFYSYDAAASWQLVEDFGPTPINDAAIDYKNKCVIYLAAGNTIYKSNDCTRNWQTIYFDSREGLQINKVATEWYNSNYIYAGNNKGEVLKSLDEGKTWQTIKRLNNPIKQILVDKDDTRIIYFVTETAGIFKTADGGATWSDGSKETDLNAALNKFNEGRKNGYLVQDMTRKDSFFFACKYGILKTTDGGLNWSSLDLITPAGSANIYSLAVNPKDAKAIYYGTDTTLYKTSDGGENWQTLKSPTPGIINVLLLDPKEPKIIYLGTKYKN